MSGSSVTSLRDVIHRHLDPAGPRVLTAHDRLDVPVRWVHSSEIFEIGPLLSGGELLLTTGLGLGGLDAGTRRHYVRDLAERGVAGLAFEIGRTFDAVPEEMVREGSSVGLPIIELNRVLPFIDICRDANTAIVSDEIDELRLRTALDDALHDDLVAPGGVARMLAHVAETTGRALVLVGAGGALLAVHGVDDDRSAWRLVDASPVSVPVIVRDREIARLVASGDGPEMPLPQLTALLRVATGPIASTLTRSGARHSVVGARLVEEMVGGRALRRVDLIARLAGAGVPAVNSTRLVTVAADAPDPRMAESVLTRAAAATSGLVQATIDATVFGLVAAPPDAEDPVDHVADAVDKAAGGAGRITVVVGATFRLGDSSPGIEIVAAIADSLRNNARRLDRAALHVREDRTRRVFTGRELVADDVVHALDAQTRSDLQSLVAPLVEHDARQSTQLVATLDVHLRHGCSATRSAAALHIGRQSLYQRLDRIRSLLGFDPTAAAVYPSMLLAVNASRASTDLDV
jgi:purine catabolism regulator